MFPDAQFDISIDFEDLDDIVTDNNYIVIKHEYSCYCYDNCKKKLIFFLLVEKILQINL